jgi:hypothetical protein
VAAVETKGLATVYRGRTTSYPPDAWPAHHALPLSIVRTVGLAVVFAPLARRYRAIDR